MPADSTTIPSMGSSATPQTTGRLESLPAEIKIAILCLLDDPSLPALIRVSLAYRQIFKSYRAEINTAVTLNTLRARNIDLGLQTPLCWLEVSTKFPKPRKYTPGYLTASRGVQSAICEYRRQFSREQPRRDFLEHCSACHEQVFNDITGKEALTYCLWMEAKSQHGECAACREDVIESLSDRFPPFSPIRLSPEHCTALCTIRDVVGWYWPDGESELYCFQRPSIAPYRFPVHTYTVLVMDGLLKEREFFEMLAQDLYHEDPWFEEPRVCHKIKRSSDAQKWIEREREEPMDRLTFGAISSSTPMDWLDDEGMTDAWKWMQRLEM